MTNNLIPVEKKGRGSWRHLHGWENSIERRDLGLGEREIGKLGLLIIK